MQSRSAICAELIARLPRNVQRETLHHPKTTCWVDYQPAQIDMAKKIVRVTGASAARRSLADDLGALSKSAPAAGQAVLKEPATNITQINKLRRQVVRHSKEVAEKYFLRPGQSKDSRARAKAEMKSMIQFCKSLIESKSFTVILGALADKKGAVKCAFSVIELLRSYNFSAFDKNTINPKEIIYRGRSERNKLRNAFRLFHKLIKLCPDYPPLAEEIKNMILPRVKEHLKRAAFSRIDTWAPYCLIDSDNIGERSGSGGTAGQWRGLMIRKLDELIPMIKRKNIVIAELLKMAGDERITAKHVRSVLSSAKKRK